MNQDPDPESAFWHQKADKTTLDHPEKLARTIKSSLDHLIPALKDRHINECHEAEWHEFVTRIERHFPDIFPILVHLYGDTPDFFKHVHDIMDTATSMWTKRAAELKALDAARTGHPYWYQSHRMVGATCYVDLFAGDFKKLHDRIAYLDELEVNYLHLMPVFRCPEKNNDGGYAVSSYRETNPDFGTMEELSKLAAHLRSRGISLALDFVFNHTSNEHDWAQKALAGDPEYQAYYRMYPDRDIPDKYEKTLKEIFPDDHAGAFSFDERFGKWVWTSFHSFQWDLNYANPRVFRAMMEEMLFLANQGVDVLRLDAVAFLWKEMGTACENLPEAHMIVRAFNALVRIAAPSLIFLSEAIVHPDDVLKYIDERECQLSYNPQLMALLWEALATRKTGLLRLALDRRFALPHGCAWLNYIRCHDDIGWTFSNEDAEELGINAHDHRRFLSNFYCDRFDGTFSCGIPFQDNPATGDCRVSGTTAALTGLEKGLASDNEQEIDLAIRRIFLLNGIIMTIGGIPQIYLGDELGSLNDTSYADCNVRKYDSRWAHRMRYAEDKAQRRLDPESIEGRIFGGLLQLIRIRQRNPAIARSEMRTIETGSDHVLCYERPHEKHRLIILANFADYGLTLPPGSIRLEGVRETLTDILSGRTVDFSLAVDMEPCQFMVLLAQQAGE